MSLHSLNKLQNEACHYIIKLTTWKFRTDLYVFATFYEKGIEKRGSKQAQNASYKYIYKTFFNNGTGNDTENQPNYIIKVRVAFFFFFVMLCHNILIIIAKIVNNWCLAINWWNMLKKHDSLLPIY